MRIAIYKHLGGFDVHLSTGGILTYGRYGDLFMFDEHDNHPVGKEVSINDVPKIVAVRILQSVFYKSKRF